MNWALKDVYELTIPDLNLVDSKSVWGVWWGRNRSLQWQWLEVEARLGHVGPFKCVEELDRGSKQGYNVISLYLRMACDSVD